MKLKNICIMLILMLSFSASAMAQDEIDPVSDIEKAPDFLAETINGWNLQFENLIPLSPFMLYFGEISTPDFQNQMKNLQTILLDYAGQFNVIVIAIDDNLDIDVTKEFVDENEITSIIVQDVDKEISTLYDIDSFPHIVLVERYGIILGTHPGHFSDNYDDIVTGFRLKEPETADGLIERGYIYYDRMNKQERALNDFRNALILDAESSKAHCGIGEIYLDQNNYDLAVLYLDKAIELDSSNTRAWYNRAQLEENLKNYDKAMQLYNDGVSANEEDKQLPRYMERLENKLLILNKPAPDFTIETLDGNTFDLSIYKNNKPVIIDLWATWCGPCRSLMPELQKFYDKHSDVVEIIAISAEKDGDPIPAYIEERGYTFKVAYDPERLVYDKYPSLGIPYLIVIDANGTVIETFIGFRPNIIIELEELLNIH